jgi:geranylgeranyl diphosphate synthase type I
MSLALDLDRPAALHDALTVALATALADKRRQCELIDPAVGAAAGVLAEFVLSGGKRLRPTFAWWGWRGACGDPQPGAVAGEPAEDPADPAVVLRAVAALELLQAGALLHDDVLDASTTRRGRPTVHLQLAELHRASGWLGDPARFGLAGAILLGDIALTCADDLLRDAGLSPEALRRAGAVWTAMRTEVLGGQYLDVRAQAAGDETEESALRVALFKSAAYTVVRPLQLGAAIAGAGEPLMSAYHRFGVDIGVAFQLRDDLLGVFGDPAVTGKPAGDDLREGKRTLLVALALRRSANGRAGAAAEVVRRALGRPGLTEAELDAARSALVELGAVHAVEQRIEALTESALATLDTAPVTMAAATRLAELAMAATRRTS